MTARRFTHLTEEGVLYFFAGIILIACLALVGTVGGIILVPFVAALGVLFVWMARRIGRRPS